MKLALGSFATAIFLLLSTHASAAPPSCATIGEAMLHREQPELVAEELRTTRARVNSCIKLRRVQARIAERRETLLRNRRDRLADQ